MPVMKKETEENNTTMPYSQSDCGNKVMTCCKSNPDCSRKITVLPNGTVINSDTCCQY